MTQQTIDVSLWKLEAFLLREAMASALRMTDDALSSADGHWRDDATVQEQLEAFLDAANDSIAETLREARAFLERAALQCMNES